jgi:hypothetical protein
MGGFLSGHLRHAYRAAVMGMGDHAHQEVGLNLSGPRIGHALLGDGWRCQQRGGCEGHARRE